MQSDFIQGLSQMKELMNIQRLLDDFCMNLGCTLVFTDDRLNTFFKSRPGIPCSLIQCPHLGEGMICGLQTLQETEGAEAGMRVNITCKYGVSSAIVNVSSAGSTLVKIHLTQFFAQVADSDAYLRNLVSLGFDSPEVRAQLVEVPVYEERQIVNILSYLQGMIEIMLKLGDTISEKDRTEEQLRLHAMDLELINQKLEFQRMQAENSRDMIEESRKALEQSENNYHTLVDNIPAVVYRCELLPPWHMHYISEFITTLTGYLPEDFYKGGRVTYADLVVPEDLDLVASAIEEANAENRPYELQYRIRDRANSMHWVFERGRLIRNASGEPMHLDGIIMDITIQKKVELERAEIEQRFKGLFDNMVEGVALHRLIYDSEGRPLDYLIYETNPAYATHTGIPRHEAIGKTGEQLYGVSPAAYLKEFAGVTETGVPLIFDAHMPNMGRHFHISVFTHLPGHFATVFLDITKSKEAQEQLQSAFEERKVLIREIHHRVKNNLAAIIHLIEKQIDGMHDSESKEFLKVLRSQAYTMALIYDQLNQTKKLSKIEMSYYFEELTMNIAHSFNQIDWVLTTVESDEIWMDVNLATPCAMIVNELVTNVYKYAFPRDFKGDHHLLIKLQKKDEVYHLMVRDNGVGLSEHFNLETQKSAGLQLVKLWAVHQLGGTFDIRSEGGVVVEVTFKDRKRVESMSEENN
jgi:PAS domain S-box-containing protein